MHAVVFAGQHSCVYVCVCAYFTCLPRMCCQPLQAQMTEASLACSSKDAECRQLQERVEVQQQQLAEAAATAQQQVAELDNLQVMT